jgi:hypothetical protein
LIDVGVYDVFSVSVGKFESREFESQEESGTSVYK